MKQKMIVTPTKSQLAEMNIKIEALKTRSEESKGEAKEAFETQIRALEDQFDLLKARLEKASKKVGAASSEMEEGVRDAWTRVQKSYERAKTFLH